MTRPVLALAALGALALALPLASANASRPTAGPCLPAGITLPPGSPKLPPCKNSTTGGPQVFVAKYHLSGYGVFRDTFVATYTAAPCQAGGQGGGEQGTIRSQSTIRWETARPATVTVQGIGGQPAMLPSLDPATKAPGAIVTATVKGKVTDDRKRISCDLGGNPVVSDEPGKAERTQCGTHTYRAGYYMGTTWPKVAKQPGQRISVGVAALPATTKRLEKDWAKCWNVAYEVLGEYGWDLSAKLPFSNLPRKIRGKLTVIGHGGHVVLDGSEAQNTGGTSHYHHEYNGTNYVTWIRIG
ncbi:MAG TPA: hypothetical protein VNH40_10610 [Gaiellaceae bacterium]|nr:hypothetical protein [Gaiellaceae bacterium]